MDRITGGARRQIVIKRKDALVYKEWEGTIEVISHLKKPAVLTLTATQTGSEILLTIDFGGAMIPFSVAKYGQNPEGFFLALGIQPGPNGHTKNVARFTENGDVVVAASSMKKEVLSEKVDFEKLVDLPNSYVTAAVFMNLAPLDMDEGDVDGETEEDESDSLVIALEIIGAIMVVAVVAAIIIGWRLEVSSAEKKSNSSPFSENS
jgi:hypothetical protein